MHYAVPPEVKRRVITLPGGERFMLACDGAGYIVRADDPSDWSEVASIPVRAICVIPSHKLVLLADYTNLTAYGPHGLAWDSGQLVWDELGIVGVADTHLAALEFQRTP